MRHSAFIAFIAAGLFTISACTHYTAVKPERHSFGDAYSVQSKITWNKYKKLNHPVWTRDGQMLQAIHFFTSIEDGQPLISASNAKGELPSFSSDMRATEVARFVKATLEAMQKNKVEIENVEPAKFGSKNGFRFTLSYKSSDGLNMKALAQGMTTQDGKLHLITYKGTSDYYFPKYRSNVEAMLDSVRLI